VLLVSQAAPSAPPPRGRPGGALAAIGLRTAALLLPLIIGYLAGYLPMQILFGLFAAGGLAGALLIADRNLKGLYWEILAISLILMLGTYLAHNTIVNLADRKIATGYGFLDRESRFEISESLISYSAASTYGRAMLVGFLNTLKVSIIGIVLATMLGVGIGILGLTRNWLVARLCGGYIHFLRNIPVLLHIFLWYTAITNFLPPIRQALSPVAGVFLTQRGLFFPVPVPALGWTAAGYGLIAGAVLAWAVYRYGRAQMDRTGTPFPSGRIGIALVLGLPILAWLVTGAPTAFSVPELKGFNFDGGTSWSPEFFAILGALSTYTSSYIAENTRAGILAVSRGQIEAGRSLGLSEGVIMRQVILPQALRVIIPPTTNQYLNLTKNSSLSVAVGYPDLVSIANTTLNQTGQAIECISIIMMVYLATSLATSALMNWYNGRIKLVDR
jgi:general L-amino acid transport system permease protein